MLPTSGQSGTYFYVFPILIDSMWDSLLRRAVVLAVSGPIAGWKVGASPEGLTQVFTPVSNASDHG